MKKKKYVIDVIKSEVFSVSSKLITAIYSIGMLIYFHIMGTGNSFLSMFVCTMFLAKQIAQRIRLRCHLLIETGQKLFARKDLAIFSIREDKLTERKHSHKNQEGFLFTFLLEPLVSSLLIWFFLSSSQTFYLSQ